MPIEPYIGGIGEPGGNLARVSPASLNVIYTFTGSMLQKAELICYLQIIHKGGKMIATTE